MTLKVTFSTQYSDAAPGQMPRYHGERHSLLIATQDGLNELAKATGERRLMQFSKDCGLIGFDDNGQFIRTAVIDGDRINGTQVGADAITLMQHFKIAFDTTLCSGTPDSIFISARALPQAAATVDSPVASAYAEAAERIAA